MAMDKFADEAICYGVNFSCNPDGMTSRLWTVSRRLFLFLETVMTTQAKSQSKAAAQPSVEANAKSQTGSKSYFDLTTYVDGFVSRIREIQGRKKSDLVTYCTIGTPMGFKDANGKDVYTNFDVRVCGEKTLQYINSIRADVDAGRKVVVRASIGDIYADAYLSNDETPAARAIVKGRMTSAKAIPQGENLKEGSNTLGLGYLNEIREVKIAGETAYVAKIAAIRGDVSEPDHTYFDALVDKECVSALGAVAEHLKIEGTRVLVGFELTNVRTSAFMFTKGKNAGKPGASINCNLLHLRHAKANGVRIELPSVVAEKLATGTHGDQ